MLELGGVDLLLPHTFVVLAYKESPHLELCLRSLKAQSKKSTILIATSTPNEHIQRLAAAFEVAVRVNPLRQGIVADWNYALSQADSDFVTLAHQDDLYEPTYVARCLEAARDALPAGGGKPLIVFTDYEEVVGESVRRSNSTLVVKRLILRSIFLVRPHIACRRWKRWLVSFGSPIPAPSVMFHRAAIPHFLFSDDYSINMDWDAWVRLCETDGSFVFVPERLLLHRIHPESETSAGIADARRPKEDLIIFRRLWPEPIASLLARAYRLSYATNVRATNVRATNVR